MKKKFIVFGILLVIVIILLVNTKKQEILPNSFNMKLYGDFTSSGASRKYEATLKFIDKKLVEGKAIYGVGDINGEQHY